MKQYYEILVPDEGELFFWDEKKYRYVSEAEKAHNEFYDANKPSARRRKFDQPLGDCDCIIALCCVGD